MLITIFRNGISLDAIVELLLILPLILISLTVHEYAHGYAAYKCGDGTARAFGRLTFNPVKHLDPIGFIAILLMGFGWAKPVPVNPRNLRKPKRDMALVSIAGPASNFVLAFVFAFLFSVTVYFLFQTSNAQVAKAIVYIATFFKYGVILNITLALFNLIPIPPLDGSKILATLLPHRLAGSYLQWERNSKQYMRIAIFALIALSWMRINLISYVFWPLWTLSDYISDLFFTVFSFLY